MELGYLMGALGITAIFYGLGWGLVNFFRAEDTPRKSFSAGVKRVFTDSQLTGIQRYILVERLLAVVILCTFSTIVYYRYWSTGGQLDLNQSTWIPFSALLLLSFCCTIPLMFWSLRVLAVVTAFSEQSIDLDEVHWLQWLRQLLRRNEQRGCLLRLLHLFQFVILCFQFLLTYAFCYAVLKIAFIP